MHAPFVQNFRLLKFSLGHYFYIFLSLCILKGSFFRSPLEPSIYLHLIFVILKLEKSSLKLLKYNLFQTRISQAQYFYLFKASSEPSQMFCFTKHRPNITLYSKQNFRSLVQGVVRRFKRLKYWASGYSRQKNLVQTREISSSSNSIFHTRE